jgi:hypothetical protein
MNTSLCPVPRLQFSDLNGVPLAGGFVYTYAAGTSTPQATYQDSAGATPNTNPIVLDSTGSALIWLAALNYKIQLTDLNGVVQWTVDQVSSVSQTELQGSGSFSSLAVTGSATIGGTLVVTGAVTAPTLTVTGSASVNGALAANSSTIAGNASVAGTSSVGVSAVSGNETVGGTLVVTGMGTFGDLTVNGVEIDALITSLIPVVTAVAGTLIITNVATVGNWVIFTFGATAGTRVRIALGAGGGLATGASIPIPSGFSTSGLIAGASVDSVTATSGNQLSHFNVSVAAGVVTVAAGDASGHVFTPTAAWWGFCVLQGY